MALAVNADVVEWLELDETLDPPRLQKRTALIDRILEAASEAVQSHANRRFDSVTEQRTFHPEGRPADLTVGDVRLVTEVTEAGETLDGENWRLMPPAMQGRPSRTLRRLRCSGWGSPVTVAASWGWPSVPDAVVQATTMLAARLYQRSQSPTGSATMGGEQFYVRTVDPDIAALIAAYKLPAVG